MDSLLMPAYHGTFALYGLALVSGLMGRPVLERPALLLAVAANAALLGLIVALSGHAPTCLGIESFVLVGWLVGVGALLTSAKENGATARRALLAFVLVVLTAARVVPMIPEPYRYYFGEPDVLIYFSFRLLSLATMLYATGNYVAFAASRREGERPARLYERGHRFLLLGVLFFLVSEFAGCWWLWRGWGDFWKWKASFLEGALVLLYAMLVLHLPTTWVTLKGRAWAGALTGVLMLVSLVLHNL